MQSTTQLTTQIVVRRPGMKRDELIAVLGDAIDRTRFECAIAGLDIGKYEIYLAHASYSQLAADVLAKLREAGIEILSQTPA